MKKKFAKDAIEIITDIPEWQKKETLKRLEAYKSNPDEVASEHEVLSLLIDADNR